MNSLQDRAHESPLHDSTSESSFYPAQTRIISTLALLALGYYALSLLDVWPSTIKRSMHELILHLTPSPLIYVMERSLVQMGYLGAGDAIFERAGFGDLAAKEDAMRWIFRQPRFPQTIQKVRTLSGPLMTFGSEIGPPGLGNWDNSCYQNSVLQGFASLPAFLDYMGKSETLCDRYNVPATTHRAMAPFLDQLADSLCRTSVLWTPRVLKSMDSWQQQDAQEYFSRVLEAVEKEAKQYSKQMSRSQMAGLECLGALEDNQFLTRPTVVPANPSASPDMGPHELRNPIEGMTAQFLQCKTCGFTEGLSLTQFSCLTLNLGLQAGSDIQTLLEEYTAPEDIEGVECDNCSRMAHSGPNSTTTLNTLAASSLETSGEKTTAVLRTKAKQITVGRLPKDLVLHLNRSIFDSYGNQLKNAAPVGFPMKLEFLRRWCAPLHEDDSAVEAVYELKCIVTHYGSHHDGHYIALGIRDKDWYLFNDERVSKVTAEEVMARGNGFIFFYETSDSPPPPRSRPRTPDTRLSTPRRTRLDTDQITTGSLNEDHDSGHSRQNAREQRLDGVSNAERLDPHLELGQLLADVSRDDKGDGSPEISPLLMSRTNMTRQIPAMKTASDSPIQIESPHTRGAPAVPVL